MDLRDNVLHLRVLPRSESQRDVSSTRTRKSVKVLNFVIYPKGKFKKMRDIIYKKRWLNWKTLLISLPVLNLATTAFAQTDSPPAVPPVWWDCPNRFTHRIGIRLSFLPLRDETG